MRSWARMQLATGLGALIKEKKQGMATEGQSAVVPRVTKLGSCRDACG